MVDQGPLRYTDLLLPNKEPFPDYSCVDHLNMSRRGLGPLSQVNVFIGANNTGKSRLLRALFATDAISHTTNEYNADALYQLIEGSKEKLETVFNKSDFASIDSVSKDLFNEILALDPHFVNPEYSIHEKVGPLIEKLRNVRGNSTVYKGMASGRTISERTLQFLKTVGETLAKDIEKYKVASYIDFKKKYYIPMLRGMRPLSDRESNYYKVRTIQDYFPQFFGSKLPDDKDVFTGIELYDVLKKKLLGEPEDRAAVRRFEEFLSKKFFQSQPITLIPYEGDTTVRVKIGNEKQLPIYALGDGLQNLLICVFNIFMEANENNKCLFFMEEPDLSMHPSLQRVFLEVLSSFKQHQYFITTHSNHLLDMTLDFSNISVFHFSKSVEDRVSFQIKAASSRDHNLLRDIGVRNSSVFLTNATIWVEGITDRLYLRAYMSKYCQELRENDDRLAVDLDNLKEDLHYSFVEYQGSNLIHWTFDPTDDDIKKMKATYVCAHAFLVADGDVSGKGSREEVYRAMLSDRFYILKAKEIENYIPQEILRPMVANDFHERGKSEELIEYSKYSNAKTGLGAYLDKLLGESVFKAPSGTIKSKVSFCEKAIEAMQKPDVIWNLPEELRNLCKLIYDHILQENREQGAVSQ